jgi:hypothetical protein
MRPGLSWREETAATTVPRRQKPRFLPAAERSRRRRALRKALAHYGPQAISAN